MQKNVTTFYPSYLQEKYIKERGGKQKWEMTARYK